MDTLQDGGLATLNERLRLLYGGLLLMGQQSSAENERLLVTEWVTRVMG